jgi:hypothetical protein
MNHAVEPPKVTKHYIEVEESLSFRIILEVPLRLVITPNAFMVLELGADGKSRR